MLRKTLLTLIVTLVAFDGVPLFSGTTAQAAAPVKRPAQGPQTPLKKKHHKRHHHHHRHHHHKHMTQGVSNQMVKKHHRKKHHHKKHHRKHKMGKKAAAPLVVLPSKLV